MAAAYGLYTHIQSNKRRSIALLLGLFFLVYLMVFAGALLAEALTLATPRSTGCCARRCSDLLWAAPFATLGTALWIVIAYFFNQSLIDAVTGGREVTRQGAAAALQSPGKSLHLARHHHAEAQGDGGRRAQRLRQRPEREAIFDHGDAAACSTASTTREIEAVLGHELTHIRNGDVRMLVIAVIIAGVISFFAELLFRMLFQGGLRWGGGRSLRRQRPRQGRRRGIAIVIAIALIAVAWLLSVVIRFALSRKREFLADAGSVELTKNPDAMISALRKIEGRGELRRRDLRGHGNVHRQSARGLRRPVRHPSVDRKPDRGAGPVCRRPRSRPARAARGLRGDRRTRPGSRSSRRPGPGAATLPRRCRAEAVPAAAAAGHARRSASRRRRSLGPAAQS